MKYTRYYLIIGFILTAIILVKIRAAKIISISTESMAQIELINYSIYTWEIPTFRDSVYHSEVIATYAFDGSRSLSMPYTMTSDTLEIKGFSTKTIYMPVNVSILNSKKYRNQDYIIPNLSFQIGKKYRQIVLVDKID